MIKFFRKIRQRLLTENKFSKYLIYAVGEIVLVMIGILLALQVNNWNENRKEIERQKKLYANLKIDFQSRLNELEDFYIAKNAAVENINIINTTRKIAVTLFIIYIAPFIFCIKFIFCSFLLPALVR